MRIGLNVPNELLKRVKEIDPRVNVSEVCRKALQLFVEDGSRASSRVDRDEVDEKIAWLDAQTAPPEEPDWIALALDDAAIWLKGLTVAGWEQFLHQCDVLKKQGRDEAEMVDVWSSMYGAKGIRVHLHESQEWLISEYEREEVTGIRSNVRERANEAYARAWLGYVHEVRRRLEERREEARVRRQAEREATHGARAEPELPDQLL
ncbi:MAG: hypothetical protein OXK21_08995 [Chloroflexota bacterium]|nr:hypothetical protein [Chloroflexota bacterium]